MSNNQELKNEAIDASKEAMEVYKRRAAARVSKSKLDKAEVVDAHPEMKEITIKIVRISRVLETLKRRPQSQDVRRLITGFQTWRAELQKQRDVLRERIKSGLDMDYNSAGIITQNDRKVLRASKKELKNIQRTYKANVKYAGKGKDHAGIKVKEYQMAECRFVQKNAYDLVSRDGAISDHALDSLVSKQKELSSAIDSKKGKIGYQDYRSL